MTTKLPLQQVPEEKMVKNRMHLDIEVADIDTDAARLDGLGGHRVLAEAQVDTVRDGTS
jgi:hypothetical protein